MAHTASRGYPQGRIVRAKVSTLCSDSSSTDGSFDASWRQGGAWVTHECFQKGVSGARRGRSGRRWRLAGAALDVAGAAQGPLWASLGPRRTLSGRLWRLAGAAVGVAGGSQRPLWASLGPRRGRSGRRWRLAGAALDVAGAAQGPLWAASLHFDAEVTLSVTMFSKSVFSQSPSISPQCFILVSTLSFPSKVYLGFNAFLHFNVFLHFNA